MLAFAWYLLKVIIVSGILLCYYWIVLRNKKFHRYNRFYLLAAIIVSWLIPLLKIKVWEDLQQPQVVKLLTVVANGNLYVEKVNEFKWDWNFAIILVMLAISALFLVRFIIAISRIKTLISKNPAKKWNDIIFVLTNAEGTPFSFFSYIFWNDQIDLNSREGAQILKHEVAHVQEKHSVDKLFLQVVLIIHWFNPFLWLTQKELNMIHEFIADEKAIDEGDGSAFAAMLLKTAYPAQSSILINSFFHSPIKRRLLMLTSSKKTSFTYLRRLAILPLLIFTCVLFAFTLKKNDRSLFEKNRADYQTEKNSLNLEEKLADKFDEEMQDTTYKKKRSNATGVGVDNQDKTVRVDTAASKTKITISTKESKESVNKVLVVLDGKEMSWKEFEKKEIKPEKIQSMNVLKGESAIAKYGDKGKDGVIEITSKGLNAVQNNLEGEQNNFKEQQKNFEAQQKNFEDGKKNFELQQKNFEAQQKNFESSKNNFKDQRNQEQQSTYSKVFTKVENPPYYADGMSAFAEYINKNLQYPKDALQSKVEGAVLIQFIVNEEGKLTDFQKISNKGHGLEEEAIRLLKNSGDWKPGIQNGRKVPAQVQQQVIFKLPKTP